MSNDAEKVKGVIRFSLINDNERSKNDSCVVDGVIDGLSPGFHGIHIHECGDISNGCESLGDHYNPRSAPHGAPDNDIDKRHAGDLGNIQADAQGRARFRFVDPVIQVNDIIGRSVVVTENPDDLGRGGNEQSLIDGNSGKRYASHSIHFNGNYIPASFPQTCLRNYRSIGGDFTKF